MTDAPAKTYDVIVVGLGAMGGAALRELARRGCSALGIEQFDVAHDRGSSHGQTRLIRRSYFEHPDYVPLVDRSFEAWAELERVSLSAGASDRKLFERCGLLLAGSPEGEIISGVRRAASEHRLSIETVEPRDLRKRFPGFAVTDGMEVLFEPDAGFLHVERCVRAQVEQAVALGAELVTGRRVEQWSADGTGVTVRTDKGDFVASRLVLCAGAWTGQLLNRALLRSATLLRSAALPPLVVQRRVVLWFAMSDTVYSMKRGCPAFGFEALGGFFYGFPSLDGARIKVGEHTGDDVVADPDQIRRELLPDDDARIRSFVRAHLPRIEPIPVDHSVCMYTMTPDQHFVIDRLPDMPNVVFAAGFSGHGFKFAPVVGSLLADLVTGGDSAGLSCDLFRAARFP